MLVIKSSPIRPVTRAIRIRARTEDNVCPTEPLDTGENFYADFFQFLHIIVLKGMFNL